MSLKLLPPGALKGFQAWEFSGRGNLGGAQWTPRVEGVKLGIWGDEGS